MPELDEYCTEFLEQLPLSKLRGKNKKLVEMILREIPADYSGYIDGNSSLLLLVQLSKSLNKKRKINKKTMQNIDELIISCRDLAFERLHSEAIVLQDNRQAETSKRRRLAELGSTWISGLFKRENDALEKRKGMVAGILAEADFRVHGNEVAGLTRKPVPGEEKRITGPGELSAIVDRYGLTAISSGKDIDGRSGTIFAHVKKGKRLGRRITVRCDEFNQDHLEIHVPKEHRGKRDVVLAVDLKNTTWVTDGKTTKIYATNVDAIPFPPLRCDKHTKFSKGRLHEYPLGDRHAYGVDGKHHIPTRMIKLGDAPSGCIYRFERTAGPAIGFIRNRHDDGLHVRYLQDEYAPEKPHMDSRDLTRYPTIERSHRVISFSSLTGPNARDPTNLFGFGGLLFESPISGKIKLQDLANYIEWGRETVGRIINNLALESTKIYRTAAESYAERVVETGALNQDTFSAILDTIRKDESPEIRKRAALLLVSIVADRELPPDIREEARKTLASALSGRGVKEEVKYEVAIMATWLGYGEPKLGTEFQSKQFVNDVARTLEMKEIEAHLDRTLYS